VTGLFNTRWRKLRGLGATLRHVPTSRLVARLRREIRTRRLRANPQLMAVSPISPEERKHFVQAVTQPYFIRLAQRAAELTHSSFSFDPIASTLLFKASGDCISLSDIEQVAWTKRGGIPVSDLNRSWFMAFVEQATLLSGNAEDHLAYTSSYIRSLCEVAPIASEILPIPWQPLAAARRLINSLAGLSLVLNADPSLADSEDVSFLIEHTRLLNRIVGYLREDDLGYNHLASEVFAQSLGAYVSGDTGFQRRLAEFLSVVEDQVAPDGFQMERTATYQTHVLGHLEVVVAGAIAPDSIKGRLESLTERMRGALAIMTHPDGGVAVFKDSAIGDGPSPASLGAWPRKWVDGRVILPDAGYARLQGGSLTAIFNAGQCGPDDNPGHAHADFLAFELSLGESRLVVDPGVATYKAGPERDWTRSAGIHNGPTFIGQEPIEFTGPFRVGRRGRAYFLRDDEIESPAPIFSAGWQDGFDFIGGRVARWIGLWPDSRLVLVDTWRGLPDLEAASKFLVPVPWTLERMEPGSIEFGLPGTDCRASFISLHGKLEIEGETLCFPYGPRKPVRALALSIRAVPHDRERTASLAIIPRASVEPGAILAQTDVNRVVGSLSRSLELRKR
jgi:hypothetical protein